MSSERKRGSENSGPSTNEQAVPDGLEGSIMEESGDERDRNGRGASQRGQGATSKPRGDREEGEDRTVHDL